MSSGTESSPKGERRRGTLAVALSGGLVAVAAWASMRRARARAKDAATEEGCSTTDPPPHTAKTPAVGRLNPETEGTPDAGQREPREFADSPRTEHHAVRAMVALVVLLVCAAVAIPLAIPANAHRNPLVASHRSGDARHSAHVPLAETVTSVLPVNGTSGAEPDTTIQVTFSEPLAPGSPDPSLSPPAAGTWQRVGAEEMLFTPTASLVPSKTYTLTVPGGSSGVRGRDGAALTRSVVSAFTVAPGSVLRLQQLLATLGYLPLSFSGTVPAAAQMAMVQSGAFAWRETGFPAEYTSLWAPTQDTALTRGAIMAFETQNGLAVDGDAGPAVWAALLADAVAGKKNGEPVTYVLVSKSLPQHLTVWVNGVLTFAKVPCNTGVPGATTADGTFQVFSHVQVSNMRGTDVTGSSYDVTVPWASYFNGGDALHGYPRASYGYPQSNGCVEMEISTAGRVWPYTPIGTVVTVAE